jgi:hypothetical protein
MSLPQHDMEVRNRRWGAHNITVLFREMLACLLQSLSNQMEENGNIYYRVELGLVSIEPKVLRCGQVCFGLV